MDFLPELALGVLTLWLLCKEGLDKAIDSIGPSKDKIKYSIKRYIQKSDIIIKVVLAILFFLGVPSKFKSLQSEVNFQKEVSQKVTNIENRLLTKP